MSTLSEKKVGWGSVLDIRIYTADSFDSGEYYDIAYVDETARHRQRSNQNEEGIRYNNQLQFIVAQNRPEVEKWLLENIEEDFIVCFKDAHERWLKIGDEVAEVYATLSMRSDIPNTLAGRNEVGFEFSVNLSNPAKFITDVAGAPLGFTVPSDFRVNASETTKGVVEIATLAELQNAIKFGGTNARLVVPADLIGQIFQKKSLTQGKIWLGNASNLAEEADMPASDLPTKGANILYVNPASPKKDDTQVRAEAIATGTPFATIQVAFNAAASGDKIILVADVDSPLIVNVAKRITIEIDSNVTWQNSTGILIDHRNNIDCTITVVGLSRSTSKLQAQSYVYKHSGAIQGGVTFENLTMQSHTTYAVFTDNLFTPDHFTRIHHVNITGFRGIAAANQDDFKDLHILTKDICINHLGGHVNTLELTNCYLERTTSGTVVNITGRNNSQKGLIAERCQFIGSGNIITTQVDLDNNRGFLLRLLDCEVEGNIYLDIVTEFKVNRGIAGYLLKTVLKGSIIPENLNFPPVDTFFEIIKSTVTGTSNGIGTLVDSSENQTLN